MEKSAACDGHKFAEPTKEQVAALVNGNENQIEQAAAGSCFLDHDRGVEGHRNHQRSAGNRLPICLEGFEKRQPLR